MVLQDSSSKVSTSSVMNQYTFSDMVVGPTSFEDHGCTSWDGQTSNVLPSIQSLGERICRSMDLVQAVGPEDSEMFRQRHLMNLRSGKDPDFSSALGKGLSLSIGSHLPSNVLIPSFNYRETEPNVNQVCPSYLNSREGPRVQFKQIRGDCSSCGDGIMDNTYASSSVSHNHFGSITYNEVAASLIIRNSRYLKPAQTLLEEVVSVTKAVELESHKQLRKEKSIGRILLHELEARKPAGDQKRNALCNNAFSSANKHDIQIKITKLVALLEEVNSRYEQYRHRMEEVVSSFEVVAGLGSAKSYTTLALKAMSRHFCSLRNAIVAQLCAARRCLSENSQRSLGSLAQLSLFDHIARQKRAALQQLGVIPSQQVWRPLRGLPENSVAILRTWLFEHFLHPYPSDSEKLMLATQTGLTRNQVSNWFINARVRLWKPMIEEMYREEIEEASMDSSSSTDNTSMIQKGVSQMM
ncbi:hypothetical protein AAC387_Pa05g3183 [Persea americana]